MLVIGLIAGLIALVGYAIAHRGNSRPSVFIAEFGGIEKEYSVGPEHALEGLRQAANRLPGVRVVGSTPTAILLNVRPNLTRLDDGLGLFVRATVSAVAGGTAIRLDGQRKTKLNATSRAARGLTSFERQLRMEFKRHLIPAR